MKKAFLTTFLAVCVIGTFVGCGEKNQVQDNNISAEEIATNEIEENDNSEEEKIEITKELEENSMKIKEKMTKMFESNGLEYREEENSGLERIIVKNQSLKDGDLVHSASVNINYNSGIFKFTDFIGYDKDKIKESKPVVNLNDGVTKIFIEGVIGESVDLTDYTLKINNDIEKNYPKLIHEGLEEFFTEVNGYKISIVPNMGMYKNGVILSIESDISE